MAVRTAQTFATLLRQHRSALRLTQEELAERAAVSPRTVSDLERGLTSRPYRSTVRQLCDALALPRADRARFLAAARGAPIGESSSRPSRDDLYPTNLPNELTSLVGRETEVRILQALLTESDVRLLTLLGAGGTGKTRLALRVGRETLPWFPDGVYVVSLAPLEDPGLVLPTVATVLGVPERGDRALHDAVTDYLEGKEMLLILDNLERLVAAGPTVTRLLEGAAGLRIVMTSRVALHLYGEHEFPVSPLAVPDPDGALSIEALSCFDAVALFVARAREVQPAFALTPENAASVAVICSHLDGLPLAIELVARRMKLFSPEALLQRLGNRLTLLTGGASDLPARQQTLRHTIDWSYSLLSKEDQILFARLSVFADGWTLEAAEFACNRAGELDLIEGMESLLDQCLVRRDAEESRFSMLETIREYAREKLEASGEVDAVACAHASYYAEVIEARALSRSGQEERFRWLEVEQDNIRAALAWMRDHGHVEPGLRIAGRLNAYWLVKARFTEGRRWLESLLEARAQVAAHVRARALLGLGQLAYTQGEFEAAEAYLQEGLQLCDEAGDPALQSRIISDLGVVACNRGDLEHGIPLLERAVAAAREAGNLSTLGRAMGLLSYSLVTDGQIERGLLLAEEAMECHRSDGTVTPIVGLLDTIARGKFELGDIAGAHHRWHEGLRLARKIGYTYQVPYYLEGLARVAARQGDVVRAARLFAAEEERRMTTAAPRSAGEIGPRERDLALVQERTDDEIWRRAWDEGRAMTVEQAIEYALEECR